MPIAKFNQRRVPASSGNLLRDLLAGIIDPSSLTPLDQIALRNHGKIALERALTKITAGIEAKRTRVARREQRLLLRHPAIRIFVAYLAIRKVRLRSGSQVMKAALPPFERVWGLAQQLVCLGTLAGAIPIRKSKARGGYRTIYQFDELGVAKQWLALYALKPFASIHPSSLELKRGQSVACEELLKAMESALPGTLFIQFDVRDYFGSISHEWLLEHLPYRRR